MPVRCHHIANRPTGDDCHTPPTCKSLHAFPQEKCGIMVEVPFVWGITDAFTKTVFGKHVTLRYLRDCWLTLFLFYREEEKFGKYHGCLQRTRLFYHGCSSLVSHVLSASIDPPFTDLKSTQIVLHKAPYQVLRNFDEFCLQQIQAGRGHNRC